MPSTVGAPRLVAYDRRGYGASASLHSAADHVADLKQAVDTLGVGRVFLVGNSAGAGIACQFALHWPDDVAGLLLLAPAVPGAPAPEMAAFPPAQRQLIQRALETREAETGASAEVRLWLDGAAANGGRVGGSIRRAAYDLILDNRRQGGIEDANDPPADTWERLDEITAAVRIVAGGMDLDFITHNATTMASRIVGARSETWPDAAHLLPLEHPARVASAIRALIAAAHPDP